MDDYEIDDDIYFDDDYVYVDESYDLAVRLSDTGQDGFRRCPLTRLFRTSLQRQQCPNHLTMTGSTTIGANLILMTTGWT